MLAASGAGAAPRHSRAPRGAAGTGGCGVGSPLAPVSAPHLDYCGGRVLAQAQIVAVLWGTPDPLAPTPSCSGTFQSCLDGFYRALVQSPQFDWLDEYQTTVPGADGSPGTGQHIGPPVYYGSVVIQPANTAALVGEADIQAELVAQINAGNLPAPGSADETIYEIHFPLGVDPSDTCSVACQDFCAYHDSWHANLLGTTGILAILPSHMPPGYPGGRDCALCGSRTDWFANLGGSISHETVESITDPDVGLAAGNIACVSPLGWYDAQPADPLSVHGEIGDMCEGLPDGTNRTTEVSFALGDGGVYTVQREWSNRYSACVGGPDDAFSVSGPEGTLLDAPGGSTSIAIHTSPPFDAGAPLPVKLSAHGLPASGVTATFTPSIVDASGASTLTLSVDADAGQTGFSFGVTAESGDTLAQTVLTVAAPDFSASAAPTALALSAGGPPASVTLTTAALSGAARSFTLATRGAAGVTATPLAGQLGAPLQLALSAAAGAPSISGTLSLSLTSAGVLHTVPLQLTLAGDDAALSAPTGLKIAQGSALSFTVSSSTRAGNPQRLTLAAQNLPTGATVSFSPAQITSGASATATLSIPDTQSLGPISITLVGQGPLAQTTLNVPLTVSAAQGGCASSGAGLLALAGLAATLRKKSRVK